MTEEESKSSISEITDVDPQHVQYKRENTSIASTVIRICGILVALVLYNGSSEMYSQAQQQYIYHYFKNTLRVAQASFQNKSTVNECPGNATGNAGNENEAQAETARWELYLSLVAMGLSLFTVNIYGILSEFLGRKLCVIIPTLGYAFETLVVVFVIYFKLDIKYFLLSSLIDGLVGSQYTFALSFGTIIADITPVGNRRSLFLALFDTAQGFGRLSTNFAAGYFIKNAGYLWPVVTATVASFAAAFIFFVAVPETKKEVKKEKVSPKAICVDLISFYTDKTIFQSRKVFWLLQAILLFITLPDMSKIGLMILEQLGSPFCWNPVQIGWYGALIQLLHYFIGLLLLKPLQLLMKDDLIAIIGIISEIAFYAMFGLSNQDYMLYIAAVLGTFCAIPGNIVKGMASNIVAADKQGALFASLNLTKIICRLVSRSVYNNIYAETVDVMRGLAMLTMAGTAIIGLILMIYHTFNSRRYPDENATESEVTEINAS